jgi:hypothetical protein
VSRAPSPQGFTPGGDQPVPEGNRFGLRHDDLVAVFAGVTGASDEQAVDVGGDELAELGGAGRAVVGGQQAMHALARLRALHRDHCVVATFAQRDAVAAALARHPVQVLVARRRVHDDAEKDSSMK